jgi:hypothetical protein
LLALATGALAATRDTATLFMVRAIVLGGGGA